MSKTRSIAPGIRNHPELALADRIARFAMCAAVFVVVLAVGLDVVSRAISVPSLSSGLFRQTVVVPVIEAMNEPIAERSPLIEHTVEQSDFQIEQKAEPVPVPEAKPSEEPQLPKPVVQPEVKQQPKAKKRIKTLPKPQPAVKAETADIPQTASTGSDTQGSDGGIGKTAVTNPAGSHRADNRAHALAVILNVIEANKSYPRRARQTGIQGTVRLAVSINAGGQITGVEGKEKHASVLLNRAALKAAEKLVGMRIEGIGAMTVEVPVRFELSGG